jgi:hypothetical protein
MTHLRVHERDSEGKPVFVEVGLDVVLGEAIVELVEWGVDEDCHFMGTSWRDMTDDELDAAINDPETLQKALVYAQKDIVKRLHEVLEDRRREQRGGE